MSQETVEFPWRHPFEDEKANPETTAPKVEEARAYDKVKARLRPYAPALGILAAIGILVVALGRQAPPDPKIAVPSARTLSVMVPVVPFPKGTVIEARMLKAVIAPAASFSKTQRLAVFTEDDIARVDDRLVAKKDLPPYRPIFWTSLELKRVPHAAPAKVKILYPDENPSGVTP
ncbi:MAG TPA: hypothetical protein VM901_09720 [Bdellovibrionota bacterium]|jgi:hypothetical protein|nr:hypothetical protein [Bdellovibrionota bacterium]